MAVYDYHCPKCGWDGARFNVRMAEADAQTCDCGERLVRSDVIPMPSIQIDASGCGYMGVGSDGRYIRGQFGGDHIQRRRFKP